MARGWESKSVESQIESSEAARSERRPAKSPAEIALLRQREDLELTRTRILRQIESSSNARYTEILRKSLVEVEAKLSRI